MVLSGLILVSNPTTAQVDDESNEIVLIDTTDMVDSGGLAARGIRVIETYDSFVMAEVTGTQKQQFDSEGKVTELPDLYNFAYNNVGFDVRQGPPTDFKMTSAPVDEFTEDYYFVKMFGPVKEEWKQEIENTGAEIYSAIPVNGFLVKMDAGQKAAIEANPHVLWVGHFDASYKVASEVAQATEPITVKVLAFPESRDSVIAQMAKQFGATGKGKLILGYQNGAPYSPYVQDGKVGYIMALLDSQTAAEVAKIKGVMRVEWHDQPKVVNDIAHSLVQSFGVTAVGAPASLVAGAYGATVPFWNHGIFGIGLVAGVSDTGSRGDHNMFRDPSESPPYNSTSSTHRKYVRYLCGEWSSWDSPAVDPNQDDPNDHGTHTTGTVVGYDNYPGVGGTSLFDGQAPGAKLSFCDVGNGDPDGYVYPPNDYTIMWAKVYEDGGTTQSNSWGSLYQDSYTMDESMIDQWIYDHPNMLFTWSAGNEGPAVRTIGNQPAAKNAIAIGSHGTSQPTSQTSATVTSFSSRGPSYDNRLKPDILASGVAVTSVDGDGTTLYVAMQGTSMSCPNSMGGVILLQDYFKQGFYPTGLATAGNSFNASHSLIKAMLVNSGRPSSTLTNPYRNYYNTGTTGSWPSVDQGWGIMKLDDCVYFDGGARQLQVYDGDNGLTTSSYIDYKYRVSSVAQDLRVTISWCDYPATPGAAIALVNNLDLTVTSPGGTVFKGNVFANSAPPNSITGGTYDGRNNIEHFRLPANHASLVTGVWNIRVSGSSVPYAPQPFAIAINGALDLGYGNIQINKQLYSEMETANIRIEDVGAGPGPLTAHVTSASTGDVEDVACTLNSTGVFLGSIGFTLNAVTLDNGVLTVQDGDTVTFTYNDVSGTVHTSTAIAKIDAAGPILTNIRVEEISHVSAIVKWTCSENGNGTIYYGPTPSLGFKTEEKTPFVIDQEIILTSLSPNTLYYYDLESWDMYGHKTRATNGGSHYTFKTATVGDVLVVISDDEGFNVTLTEACYIDAMSATGWSYNFWKCYQQGLPSLASMQTYKAVIWQVGFEHYPPFDANERALITNYNNGGGRLWIQSHDVAWAFGDTALSAFYSAEANAWMQAQCKVTWQTDPTTWATNYGLTGDPISGAYTGGVPYYPVRDGGAGDEINSVAAGGVATYVWRDSADDIAIKWISSAANGTSGVGVWGGTPTRIVTFCAEWYRFGATGITNAARTDILDKTLTWLLAHDHPDVAVSAPDGGETINTATTNIAWTRTTYGGTSVLNTKLYYSPNNGQAWYLITTLTPGTSPYTWTVSGLPNGDQYLVKVEVTDNGAPNLIGADTSNNVFTITSGTDNMGPNIVPGTETARPIPVAVGETMWFNGTIDDSLKGNSPIAAAEFFINTIGIPGTGTAMSAADGSFSSVSEAVTWSGTCALGVATYTLRMRGMDNRGNWGILENITFQVITTQEVTIASATATGPVSGSTNDAPITLTYSVAGSPTSVNLYYTTNGGTSWTLAGNDAIVDGSYSWTVPASGSYGWIASAVGGNSTEPSPPPGGTAPEAGLYVFDNIAPTILSTTFTDGATGIIAAAGYYEATFNEDMDSVGTFTTNLPGAIGSWQDPRVYRITYTTLAYSTTYTTTYGTTFTDSAGNALSGDMVKTFITQPVPPATATATGPIDAVTSNVSAIDVTYSWEGLPTSVNLYYTTNGGTSWTLLGTDSPVDGTFAWTVPDSGTYGWIASAVGGSSTEPSPPSGGTSPEATPYVVDIDPPAMPNPFTVDHFGPGPTFNNITETRYMRGVANEANNVNGLTSYLLGTGQSATQAQWSSTPKVDVYAGIRVFVRHSDGTEDQVTTAISAVAIRTANNGGEQSANWPCPYTPLEPTDSIVIRVYVHLGATPVDADLRATFTTAVLGAAQLDGGTWTVTYYLFKGNTCYFYWGTTTRNSRITNFKYTTQTGGLPTDHNTLNWTHDGTDVDHYSLYRMDNEAGPWDDDAFITNFPVGTNTYVDDMRGLADTIIWWYKIGAVDEYGNEILTVATPEPGGAVGTAFDIDLTGKPAVGWVFVSFPIAISGDIGTVLDDSVTGGGGTTWNVAKWYNPATKQWMVYRKTGTKTFTTIDNTMGVWLHLTANDGTLTTGLTGEYSGATLHISLTSGWNMVGYPSAIDDAALPAEATIVSVWQATTPYITDSTPAAVTMTEGNAYWVYVTTDCVWDIPQ